MMSRNPRFLHSLLLACLLLSGLVARLVFTFGADRMNLLGTLADDGYYYLKIAQNYWQHGALTFDGIHETNGFHPLWQIFLTIGAFFIKDLFIFIQFSMLLNSIVSIVAALVIFTYVRKLSSHLAGYLSIALWLVPPLMVRWQLMGMENSVYVFTLVWLLYAAKAMFASRVARGWNVVSSGLAMGFLFLSRTDSALFILILGFLVVLRSISTRTTIHLKQLIASGLVGSVLVIPYLLFNLVVFGDLLSVSGAVKLWIAQRYISDQGGVLSKGFLISVWKGISLWPRRIGSAALDTSKTPVVLLLVSLIFVWLLSYLAWRRQSSGTGQRSLLPRSFGVVEISFLCFVLVHGVVIYTLFSNQLIWMPWYFVPQVVFLVVFVPAFALPKGYVGFVFDAARKAAGSWLRVWNLKGMTYVGFASLLVIAQLFLGRRMTQQPPLRASSYVVDYQLISWLNANLGRGVKLAAWDAGLLGYFSDNTLVNLDGVVNSRSYFEDYLKASEVGDYIRREGIEMIVTWGEPDYLCSQPDIACDHVIYRSEDFRTSVGRMNHKQVVQIGQ